MRKKFVLVQCIVVLVLCLVAIGPAAAATPVEIESSIVKGLQYLDSIQNGDGSWGWNYMVSRTGFAVLKMEDRAIELGYDPFDPAYDYSDELTAGLDYIFKQVKADGSIYQDGGHINYETSVALMAIANSGHPTTVVVGTGNPQADGKTYKQIAQNAVNYLVGGQNAGRVGPAALGGWGYSAVVGPQDNSNSGYVVLGLTYAQKFGISIPAGTLAGLNTWVNAVQDPGNGGSWYRAPADGNWAWENILKTGNLLFEFKAVGAGTGDSRVQNAVSYIEQNWNTPSDSQGSSMLLNPINYQAMYCTMKGFEAQGISTLTVSGNPVDWYEVFSTKIVTTQNPATGSWPGDDWGDSQLTTCWALLTLEKSVQAPPADFDVVKSVDDSFVSSGDTVTFTYLVSNTKNTPIGSIVLTDDELGVISGPDSGDDGNGILDPLETWVYTKSTQIFITTVNTATATGIDSNQNMITATSNAITVTVEGTPVPEFSSLIVPVMLLGAVFLLARYSRKE
jgi:hypothetical protein